MSTIGNNINGKAAHIRDSFFDSQEKEYLDKILKDPSERALHCNLLREKAEDLLIKALDLINRVENGEFDEEKMIEVEYVISHCLAAIEDAHLGLELEREM